MAKKKAKAKGKKTAAKTKRKSAAKRELIAPNKDKRYVRRGARGEFNESDDVGASLSMDGRRKAKKSAKRGQGDKGDR